MKNYELIALLSELPAGAEVTFDCMCTDREVDVQENGKIFVVTRNIHDVDYDNAQIMLS